MTNTVASVTWSPWSVDFGRPQDSHVRKNELPLPGGVHCIRHGHYTVTYKAPAYEILKSLSHLPASSWNPESS